MRPDTRHSGQSTGGQWTEDIGHRVSDIGQLAAEAATVAARFLAVGGNNCSRAVREQRLICPITVTKSQNAVCMRLAKNIGHKNDIISAAESDGWCCRWCRSWRCCRWCWRRWRVLISVSWRRKSKLICGKVGETRCNPISMRVPTSTSKKG